MVSYNCVVVVEYDIVRFCESFVDTVCEHDGQQKIVFVNRATEQAILDGSFDSVHSLVVPGSTVPGSTVATPIVFSRLPPSLHMQHN